MSDIPLLRRDTLMNSEGVHCHLLSRCLLSMQRELIWRHPVRRKQNISSKRMRWVATKRRNLETPLPSSAPTMTHDEHESLSLLMAVPHSYPQISLCQPSLLIFWTTGHNLSSKGQDSFNNWCCRNVAEVTSIQKLSIKLMKFLSTVHLHTSMKWRNTVVQSTGKLTIMLSIFIWLGLT